eukprot:TRINITY_DN47142_c0_g1_i1.p1 TRINITY_DN47142_c0_g1~~TRINITY_DN47142_c0_g1_i1.p1  ORF type:complete len:498 (+),score=142.88 TRINITY_DN47142_c0_g1_i1:64-1494(+)
MPAGIASRRKDKWSITIEKAPDAASSGASATESVDFASEPAEEAHVLRELTKAGLPPGSPVARVRGMLSPAHCRSPLMAGASPKRQPSQLSQKSSERDSGAAPPERCDLFPDVVPKEEAWVGWLNALLQGEPVNSVLRLTEWADLMSSFGAVCSEEDGCPVITVTDLPLRVVGDIHGQLADFIHHVLGGVLRKQDQVSRWLFLGDLVDRGPHGAECLAIVALMKVLYPQYVTVLRGNHEDAPVTFVYGFWQECDFKFPGADGAAWYAANIAFTNMPVAAVVQHPDGRKFWCCHGGLSPHLLKGDPVEAVNAAQRRKYGQQRMSSFITEFEQSAPSPLSCPSTTGLIEGLLWSDPSDSDGSDLHGFAPNERGAGCLWREDISEQFCQQNGFEFVCRAHQMMEVGHQWSHNKRVLTLFSAPDYCDCANKGATLCVGPDFKRSLYIYPSAPEGLLPSIESSPAVPPMIPYFDHDASEQE